MGVWLYNKDIPNHNTKEACEEGLSQREVRGKKIWVGRGLLHPQSIREAFLEEGAFELGSGGVDLNQEPLGCGAGATS